MLYLQQYAYDPSPTWAFSAVTGLTLGAVAVVLLGDRISDLKLGNGTSLLIFTNIVSYLPASIGNTFAEASKEGNVGGEAGLLVCFLLLVFGIVYVQVRGGEREEWRDCVRAGESEGETSLRGSAEVVRGLMHEIVEYYSVHASTPELLHASPYHPLHPQCVGIAAG